MPLRSDFLSWDIESRMLQRRIRKDSNGECRYDRSYTNASNM
jgi:hypothetical protein